MNHARLAAGLPPQIMGFRTPGEKTLGEVERLDDAALRKFLHKAAQFEMDLLEPAITAEIRIGRDNFNTAVKLASQNEEGTPIIVEITEDDLKANGKLVPIGARRFARHNQQMSMINTLANSNLGNLIGQHLDTYQLARAVEDLGGFSKYEFVDKFALIREQADAMREQQIQESMMVDELSQPGLSEEML
jgi:hypothetical protein